MSAAGGLNEASESRLGLPSADTSVGDVCIDVAREKMDGLVEMANDPGKD